MPGARRSGKNVNSSNHNNPRVTAGSHSDRIARNASYLTLALTLQKVLSFVYFAYISKAVGSEEIGRYLFAISLTTIFGILIDVGLSPVLTREIAKDRDQTNTFLNSVVSIKILTAVLAYLAVITTVAIIGSPELTRHLVYITGIVMILDTFTLSFYAILRGHQVLKFEAIGTIVNKIVVMGLGIFLLRIEHNVMFLVLAILLGSSFNFCYSLSLSIRKMKWRPRIYWDRPILRRIFIIAFPFALASVFMVVFGYIDTVLLNVMSGEKGNSYVGWYGTAYKLTYAFQFIPIAVGAALFPAMSAYFVSSKEMLARTFEKAVYYLLVIVIPIIFGVFAIADKLILGVWGKAFGASIIPLQILIFSLFFVFINFPIGSLLNACNRQMRNTINLGIAMSVNVVLNLILIPARQYIGTSISSLVSTIVLCGLGLIVVDQIIKYNKKYLFTILAKTMISGGAMMAVLYALKPEIKFIYLIPIGVLVYFIVLFVIRGFGVQEYRRVYQALIKKFT
ncbi:MAG: flippase [Patescibacteria group bacterium]